MAFMLNSSDTVKNSYEKKSATSFIKPARNGIKGSSANQFLRFRSMRSEYVATIEQDLEAYCYVRREILRLSSGRSQRCSGRKMGELFADEP